MKITPLTDHFGVRVAGIQLADARADFLYPQIRSLFEDYSFILFEDQDFSDDDHLRLARLFGPLENRDAMAAEKELEFVIPKVSNEKKDGKLYGPDEMRLLDLQANMLWHTDSTFLPIPALVNILTARVIPSHGGATEFASTRHGWQTMPDALRAQLKDAWLWHRLSHSRARIDPRLAKLDYITRWPDRCWKAIWTNPVNGEDALYIASHAFAVDGMGEDDGAALIDQAIAHCTTEDKIYSHEWKLGDVVLWDERAVLHRGTPWDYNEPRTLSSICVSVSDADGLPEMIGPPA